MSRRAAPPGAARVSCGHLCHVPFAPRRDLLQPVLTVNPLAQA